MRVSTHGGAAGEKDESSAELALGSLISTRYRLDAVLGRGGSGVVFSAHDQELRRRVAIKVLHCVSADACGRMLREARICAQLQNEHIVRVFDVGYLPHGVPFLVMEHLTGEDLRARLERGPLEIAAAIEFLLQTCSAVQQTHDAGILHRDLKPANLFLTHTLSGPWIKVLDFGMSKPLHGFASTDTLTATVTGTVVGTPAYMSPEQLLGVQALDARTDVWALGVILFELLTGSRPFGGDSFPALVIAIATAEPRDPLLLRPELPPALVETVRHCLAKSPDDRPPTVRALAEDLRAPLGERQHHRRVNRWHGKSSATSPAIRASAVRDTLAFLDRFEPCSQRRVLERVPATSREIIESTPGSSWISVEHDHWTIDAIIELFGVERAIQCWRDSVPSLIDRPLLKNFVSGTVALLGRSPTSAVRLLAKGWPLIYRDFCEAKLIATPDGQPTIRFENIAPAMRRYTNYLHSWHGACAGYAHVARVRGDVRFEVSPDLAWAEAKFFWQEEDDGPGF